MNKNQNKGNVLQFLQESWKNEVDLIPNDCTVTIGGFAPGPAVMLTAEGVSEFTCLTCPQHEEADIRIFAHAAYSVSSQGCTRVVIKATTTDIAILGVGLNVGLKQLWIQKSVTAENPDVPTSVFLPCHQITDMLSSKYPEADITLVVLTAYTITGCDTVSYLARSGH